MAGSYQIPNWGRATVPTPISPGPVLAPQPPPSGAAMGGVPLGGSGSDLGSGLGFGLPGGYASALTQFLDPTLMSNSIREEALRNAQRAGALRGLSVNEPAGAQLANEFTQAGLNNYRQMLMNQIPQFWQMEQQQRNYADARADRADEQKWMREQRDWALEDRRDLERARDEERRYRDSMAGGSGSGGSGGGGGQESGGNPWWRDGQSSTGSVSGGPASGSSWDPRLGSERGIWKAPKEAGTAGVDYQTETAAQAEERQRQNPRSSLYTGGSASGTTGISAAGVNYDMERSRPNRFAQAGSDMAQGWRY